MITGSGPGLMAAAKTSCYLYLLQVQIVPCPSARICLMVCKNWWWSWPSHGILCKEKEHRGQKCHFKPIIPSVFLFVNQVGFSFQTWYLWMHDEPFGSKQQEFKEWTSGKFLRERMVLISWDNPHGKGHKWRILTEEHSYFVVRPW